MLVEPTISDILHVAKHMRAIDRREVFAMRWSDAVEPFAFTCLTRSSLKWCAIADDGEPVYVFGAIPVWPGKWDLWGFSTDRWPDVWRQVTKFIKRNMLPTMREGFGRRIDCVSLAEKVEGHKWLRHLGATEETVLRDWGRNGETFIQFTWRNEDGHGRQSE